MARKRRNLQASGDIQNRRQDFVMTVPTGSASKVQLGSAALRKLKDFRAPTKTKDDQKWQDEAIKCFNNIGELYAAIELTAKMVAACRLRAAEYSETGDICETKDERVHRVMRAFVGPDQGQRMLLRKAALSLQVTGEAYLLGLPYEGPAVEGGEAGAESLLYWEFVSNKEVRFEDAKMGGDRKVFRNSEGATKPAGAFGSPQQGKDELPLDCYIARLHRSELCYSEQATSHLRAARTICNELLDLTDVVAAIANSRLNSGILYVPQEFSFGNNKDGWQTGDGSDEDDIDYLTDVLTEHLTAPVADHTDEAALVPLIMRGPAEHGDKIKWIQISRDLDEWATGLRQELLSRLADALDIPREVMLGKGCVPDDVEIMTRTGWKTVDELEIGDETLGLDHTTGASRWSPISAINIFENTDPLVSFESSVHSSLTTPNHRWPVERFMCGACTERLSTSKGRCLRCWKRAKRATGLPPAAIPDLVQRVWVTSEEIQEGDRLVLGAPNADIPVIAKFSDAAVELCAWLATDGDRMRQQARIRQSPTANPENCDRVSAALEAEGINASVSDDAATGVRSWVFSMPEVLDMAGTRPTIPLSMVASLTRSQLALLLEVGVAANGHHQTGTSSMFALDSERLDSFELAAILSGFRVSRTLHRQGEAAYGTGDLTRLSWGPRTRTNITAIGETAHAGRVWCPTVEGTQSWLARSGDRNTTYYTGNSLNHWCYHDVDRNALKDMSFDEQCEQRLRVYTRSKGWVFREGLEVGDELLTLNQKTGVTEWHPVSYVYEADVVDEPMLEMDSLYMSGTTTMDHRWPVKRRFCGEAGCDRAGTTRGRCGPCDERLQRHLGGKPEPIEYCFDTSVKLSSELSRGDLFTLAAPSVDHPPTDQKVYEDEAVRLVAWLSTDGNIIGKHQSDTRRRGVVRQSPTGKAAECTQIEQAFRYVYGDPVEKFQVGDDPAWRFRYDEKAGVNEYWLSAEAIEDLVDSFVGTEQDGRFVVSTAFVEKLTEAQKHLFLEASLAGNGHQQRGQTCYLFAKDGKRLDAAERAAVLLGFRVSRNRHNSAEHGFSDENVWRLGWGRREYIGHQPNKAKIVRKDGVVWCPHVTENHNYLAMHNGKTFFTGNTGFNVDSDLVTKHILPIGQLIAEFIASSYLRPMLEEFEGMTPEEACRYTVEFDAQAIVARHNEAQVADRLFTLGCIGKKALLRASGFSESDQPTEEEQAQMFLLNGIRNAPIQYRWAIPYVDIFDHLGINPAVASGLLDPEVIDNDGYIDTIKLLHGPDGLEKITDPTRPEDNPDGEAGEPYDPNKRPSEAEEVDEVRESGGSRNSRPPATQAPQTPTSTKRAYEFEANREVLVEKLLTAADAAYVQAMTKAASRYVSRAKIRRQQGDYDKLRFMSTIGPNELEEAELTSDELLEDAWVELKDRGRPWVRELFSGHPHEADYANTVVLQLEANMHAFALANFHNEPRMRDRDMYVPVELITDALDAPYAGKPTSTPNPWVHN